MMNLIKYELRSEYKYVLAIITIAIITNFYFMFNHNDCKEYIIFINILYSVVLFIILIILAYKMFVKDINGDTGYLLFSLPYNSYTILTAKMLTAVLYFLIFSLVVIGMFYIDLAILSHKNIEYLAFVERIINIFKHYSTNLMQLYVLIFDIFIQLVAVIYFSIICSKSILKNNRHKGILTFGIFIGINIVFSKVYEMFEKYFPSFTPSQNLEYNIQQILGFNAGAIVLETIMFLMIFVITAYLMENKMDL